MLKFFIVSFVFKIQCTCLCVLYFVLNLQTLLLLVNSTPTWVTSKRVYEDDCSGSSWSKASREKWISINKFLVEHKLWWKNWKKNSPRKNKKMSLDSKGTKLLSRILYLTRDKCRLRWVRPKMSLNRTKTECEIILKRIK